MMGGQKDGAASIKTTNDALGFTPIQNNH
jgi:hypothetical protein